MAKVSTIFFYFLLGLVATGVFLAFADSLLSGYLPEECDFFDPDMISFGCREIMRIEKESPDDRSALKIGAIMMHGAKAIIIGDPATLARVSYVFHKD